MLNKTQSRTNTSRRLSFLATFIVCLFGIAATTFAQAQTAPHLDANGWTVFTPSADTNVIYVSSSCSGCDSTGVIGDQTHPYQTLAKGASLLRGGYPDWLLLKKGDVWSESFGMFYGSGRSATEPMLFSSYGTGARPRLNVASTSEAGIGSNGLNGGDYLAIVGIEFYASDRDPSNTSTSLPYYNAATTDSSLTGIDFVKYGPLNWLLIEDCKVSFFDTNVSFNGTLETGTNFFNNITLRRSVIVDSWGATSHSQGLQVTRVVNLLLEENLFDHNGWNLAVGQPRNYFNHNFYLSGLDPLGDYTSPQPATIRGNISANDSSGAQVRSGGTLSNNLWVSNPYAFVIGMPTSFASSVTNDVYLEGVSANGIEYGVGPATMQSTYSGDNYNIGTVKISNNIVANTDSPSGGRGIEILSGFVGNTITGNIVYNWNAPLINDLGTGDTVSGNVLDGSGSNNGSSPEPFSAPTRSVGSYAGTLGLTATLDGFLIAARAQSKDNWSAALMAAAVNNYVRAGFGSGSTADTTPPSVPTGLTAAAVSSTQVNLSWAASTDNVGVTGYNVFRNGAKVGAPSNTSYQDTGLSAGTAYVYAISAYDAAGNTSAQSSSVSVTTPAPPPILPSVAIISPTNGSVVSGSVSISVSASSAIGIASITITADGNAIASCADVTSCATTWQKKKISKGTHSVGATAVDANGSPANASVTIVER